MKIFEPYKIRNLELKNRVVMPPMCMNMAEEGHPTDFHNIHYGNAALGEIGMIIVEATGVTPEGRILERDLGIWSDDHIKGHRAMVNIIKKFGSRAAIQLGHAGRKCGIEGLTTLAPSAVTFSEKYAVPKAMDASDVKYLIEAFREGARRSVEAGYELIELHGAHGYLIHQFLSPLTNQRTDTYGGSRENRVRFLKEVAEAVKEVVPKDFPVILRVSASDLAEGGIDVEEMVKILDLLKGVFDMIHVSSGGLVPWQEFTIYPGYQVRLSEIIRSRCQIPTIAVGLITEVDQAEEILQNERADLVAMGRVLLRDPFIIIKEGRGKIKPLFAYQRGFHVDWVKR